MKRRRRIHPRFGLRSILVLTTVVAVVCGGWLRQAQEQRYACDRLKEAGVAIQLADPPNWLNWLPKSVLSYGGGHYFCPVTQLDLRVNYNSKVTPQSKEYNLLACVSKLTSLQNLRIDCSLIDPKDFLLLSRCGQLQDLAIYHGELADDDVALLPRLPKLKSLSLRQFSKLTGKHVDVKRFPHLQSLDFAYTQLSDEALREIACFEEMQILELGNTRVTDAGIAALSSLKNLEAIDLSGTRITGKGLSAFPSIIRVHLASSDLVDESFSEISKLPKLELLDISNCGLVTDKGLTNLANHPTLKNLHATGTGITNSSTESLATMASLEYVWLEKTNVRSIGNFAACKKLQLLEVSSSEVPVSDALRFAQHENCDVRILDPKAPKQVFFGCGMGMMDYETEISLFSTPDTRSENGAGTRLVLVGLIGVEAQHIQDFSCDVKALDISRSALSNDVFKFLRNWPELTTLDASQSSVTNVDLKAVGELHQLTSLDLQKTAIDDLGLIELESLVDLRFLNLGKTAVTQSSLKVLERFANLSSLTLPFVPDAIGLIQLLESCPQLSSLEYLPNESTTPSREAVEILTWDGVHLLDVEVSAKHFERLLILWKNNRGGPIESVSGQKLNDEHCEVLANFIEINSLDLSGSSVTDAGIAHLATLPELSTLNISNTEVTAASLRSLQANEKLETIVCAPRIWSIELVQALLELKNLRDVNLPFSEMPRGIAFALTSGSSGSECSISEGGPDFENTFYYMPEDITWLAGISSVNPESQQLTLMGYLVDDAKIAEVINTSAIEFVHVKNVACNADTLISKLLTCSNTSQISFTGVQLPASELGKLSELKHLETLRIIGCQLTSDHMVELAKFRNLRTLTISCDAADESGLSELLKVTRLRSLILATDGPTEKYETLQQQLGKRCEIARSN